MGFGGMIRAWRLGFRDMPGAKGMLRIEHTVEGILCELIPHAALPPKRKRGKYHVCWWDEPDVLKASPVLKAIKEVTKPFDVLLDDNGELKYRQREGGEGR